MLADVLMALGFLLTWSATLVGTALWLSARFATMERAILRRVSEDEYTTRHESLASRVALLERWAIRVNGSVKPNFNDLLAPDYRTHGYDDPQRE